LAPLPAPVELGPASVLVRAWGQGFFDAKTLAFALKMALVMLGGWILTRSGPVHALLDAVARVPRSPRQAIAVMALVSMLLGLLNWGLSIVASAVLVRAIARRVRDVDYPLLCCAGYLGLGCVWHAGLSGSAPLLVATPGHDLSRWVRELPLTSTTFSPL